MSFFVTGTDTSCGKTVAAAAIMRALRRTGERVVGMKPVATGARETGDGLRNDDALCLMSEATCDIAYEDVNPYVFVRPVAPHIAAAAAGIRIDFARIDQGLTACQLAADVVVVEGVGGWMVPLGPDTWLTDLVRMLALPVVLVVGLKLGCINHTMLTVRRLDSDRVPLLGWVANRIEPEYLDSDATIDILREHVEAPLLGVLPHLTPPDLEVMADILLPGLEGLRA
jgi:dethiobiotin synthetase